MDPGHGELSQDADGADSAPGKRAACAFHVQPPALDTDFHPSPQKKTHSGGAVQNQNLFSFPRTRRRGSHCWFGALHHLFCGLVQSEETKHIFKRLICVFLKIISNLHFEDIHAWRCSSLFIFKQKIKVSLVPAAGLHVHFDHNSESLV